MEKYVEIAKNILLVNMAIKNDENLLIVTDTLKADIARFFTEAGKALGITTIEMSMPPAGKSGEEPPENISDAMKKADVVICITTHSVTHTKARKEAAGLGARIATMPGITMDMLEKGAITANYQEVLELTEQYSEILDQANEVVLEKDGHQLTIPIHGRKAISSTGMFTEKGQAGNLPSGESFIAPVEGKATGSIVIDGAIAGIGVLQEPITLVIKYGELISATGEDGEQLLELLGQGSGRMLAELGIGTNKSASLIGNILEDEKVFGTAHVAFGSNKSFGGMIEAGVHIDCVINDPKIIIDGRPLLLK